MKILWFTWKDRKNPLAGGAEAINEGIAKKLAENGHEVIFLVAGFKGSKKEEEIDGYRVIRVGGRWTTYFQAYKYYKKNLKGWADLVVDEVNTIPFFCKFYVKEKNILLVYQLCREIWFYQMAFPLNLIGYLAEPLYLRLLSDRSVITESDSTRADLQKHGFKKENISIIPIALDIKPAEKLENIEKYQDFTILSLGAIRKMKGTQDQLRAFEIAKEKIPELKLKIAGEAGDRYGKKFLKLIKNNRYKDDIEYLGRVDANKKLELLQRCHLILVTSVKEGWGLTVTEAGSQGTPAIVYNVDGLKDSVKNGETGVVCAKNNPQNIAENIAKLYNDKNLYEQLRSDSWQYAKEFSWTQTYEEFIKQVIFAQDRPLVSVIIPTLNSERTIEMCLDSVKKQSYKNIELIVVDNNSTDKTKEIAGKYTDKVFNSGPERSAQRNFGAKNAKGEYLLIHDSDIYFNQDSVKECVELAISENSDAIILPEKSIGEGFWAKVKVFERSFYVGNDLIEAPRFFKKTVYEKLGGYDESMTGPEDWDLAIKLRQSGYKISRAKNFLEHDEGRISLFSSSGKKKYYAHDMFDKYAKKYPNEFKKQMSFFYRFPLKKLLKKGLSHPILLICMIFMKGLEYLNSKKNK